MNHKLYPLTIERYEGKFWRRTQDWSFAAVLPLIPVVIQELPAASATMPLAFVRNKERYQLVAVLGLDRKQSLAVGDRGQWRPDHFPLMISTYPFVLVDEKNGGQMVAVDESTNLVNEDAGEPFFDKSGKPTVPVSRIMMQLKKVAVSRLATRNATNIIAEAGLLEPLSFTVSQIQLQGLYYVSEKKLRELSPDRLKALLDCGALTVVFAHLFSLSRFPLLDQWAKASITPKKIKDLDIDALFGGKDDLIKF